MRWIAYVFLSLSYAAPPDPADLVRRSVEIDQRSLQRAKDYTFVQHVESRTYGRNNEVRKTESETFDVLILDGTTFERKVAKDGKPLGEREARKERERFERERAKRRDETPAQRARRMREEEKDRLRQREFAREIPEAFTFQLSGEESIDGRRVWVIEATPKPGYRPKSSRAELLTKMKGRLWIEEQSLNWVKVEAEVIAPFRFGWVLLRVAPGTKIELRQTRVSDDLWLPSRIEARASARLGLVKGFNVGTTITFRDYRKFSADSKLLPVNE